MVLPQTSVCQPKIWFAMSCSSSLTGALNQVGFPFESGWLSFVRCARSGICVRHTSSSVLVRSTTICVLVRRTSRINLWRNIWCTSSYLFFGTRWFVCLLRRASSGRFLRCTRSFKFVWCASSGRFLQCTSSSRIVCSLHRLDLHSLTLLQVLVATSPPDTFNSWICFSALFYLAHTANSCCYTDSCSSSFRFTIIRRSRVHRSIL